MKILVPVKQVSVLDSQFELTATDTGIDPEYLELELNEWDNSSLEVALQIAEAGVDVEVVAVAVGDESADEVLLTCLAKGADRAIRVWDDRLRGLDQLAVGRVLAAVGARERPDLVLCGVQSSDTAAGSTGVAMAAHLGIARVAVVKSIELTGDTLAVERELEGGLAELVNVRLPALLTIQTGITSRATQRCARSSRPA